jgi:excinuclease ABC subunit C
MFLKGKTDELVEQLKNQMTLAAEEDRFEDATRIRDQIAAIASTTEGQSVIGIRQWQQGNNQDVIGMAEENGFRVVVMLFVRNGIIFDKRTFEFKNPKLDGESFIVEFLERYYELGVVVPDEIIVPFAIAEGALELDSKILVPRSDEKKNFLKIAEENALAYLHSKQQKLERLEKTLGNLQRLLSLSKFPNIIDCVDISHHQGAETVASVVRFKEGLPEKEGYRKIKMQENQVDDFASMRDALYRRYHEQSDLPDLLIIDGGRGQLQAAEEILKERGWLENFDLVSLAKSRDREGIDPLNPQNRERVFKMNQKNPILLKENSAEELLLQFIRDEAHRFAITYHRLRKDRAISTSVLNEVEGMTERMKLKLLRRFGSIDGLREASDDEILQEVNSKMLQRLRERLDEVYDFQGQ